MSRIRSLTAGGLHRIAGQFGYAVVSLQELSELTRQRDEVDRHRDKVKGEWDQLKRERDLLIQQRDELLKGASPPRSFFNNIFGHKMYVNPFDLGVGLKSLNDVPIEAYQNHGEIGFLLRHIKPGARIVDVGANVGFFTLLFARQAGPGGKVWAFEPGPQSFALLAKNVSINAYTNVTVENIAISDFSGTIDFYVCRTGESDNRVAGAVFGQGERDKVNVRCVALDDYFADIDAPVDFVKIDAQGAETFVVRGMETLLRRNRSMVVVLEYSPDAVTFTGSTPSGFLQQLRSFGFDIYELPEDGVEHPVSDQYLLETIGSAGGPAQTNLALMHAT
jgi:FkbM family methyltransferase